ncbi:unnamed protein product [Mycena citricolor]|uniref:Alpha-type protein kinase domain-containing protein n=1 Tax=Mycena citricolor TaxID=2018698 RepID=A0AAD2HJ99_9AGAR|nr:unnamed protein product [Mycena citricolor]
MSRGQDSQCWNSSVAASFTEKHVALQDVSCGTGQFCRGDQYIRIGQKGYRVSESGKRNAHRIVCYNCYSYYRDRQRDSQSSHAAGPPRSSAPAPDAKEIQRMNNQGRLGDVSRAQQHVSIFPRSGGTMGPPSSVPARPIVAAPSAWDRSRNSDIVSQKGSRSQNQWSDKGYSKNHAQYQASRGSWARSSYVGRSPKMLPILVGIRYEILKKPRGESYGTISEGSKIPGDASAEFIFNHVFEVLYDRLVADANFQFRENELTVRDVTTWQDFKALQSDHVFYWDKYYKISGKATKPEWKAPRASVQIALVISGREWQRRTEMLAASEPDADSNENSVSATASAVQTRVTRFTASVSNASDQTEASTIRSLARSTDREATRALSQRSGSSSSSAVVLGAATWSPDKRHERTLSLGAPSTPPSSPQLRSKCSHPGWRSPDEADFARLRKVASVGGQVSRSGTCDVPTCEQILFFRIYPKAMDALFTQDEAAMQFVCDPAVAEPGTLSVVLSAALGSGSFKDAYKGFLTLVRPSTSPTGLGSTVNQRVAAKRMIDTKASRRDTVGIRRFSPAVELEQSICEGNLLLWATSLFDLTDTFVRHQLSKLGEPPSNLVIPDIRFVEGGVAQVHNTVTGTNVVRASSLRRSFIIEELIPSRFVKFVHNRAAVPHLDPDHPSYHIALYLCFTQHVQYVYTGRSMFLSDYQGSESLLTDPQIMTTPEIAKQRGTPMFGGGNVSELFNVFCNQHVCSDYCRFFGLKPLAQVPV